jgi:hypothetical protein
VLVQTDYMEDDWHLRHHLKVRGSYDPRGAEPVYDVLCVRATASDVISARVLGLG